MQPKRHGIRLSKVSCWQMRLPCIHRQGHHSFKWAVLVKLHMLPYYGPLSAALKAVRPKKLCNKLFHAAFIALGYVYIRSVNVALPSVPEIRNTAVLDYNIILIGHDKLFKVASPLSAEYMLKISLPISNRPEPSSAAFRCGYIALYQAAV